MSGKANGARTFLLAGVLATSFLGLACSEHHSYRAYDPYYTDYHNWNHEENGYYKRWADETHRDGHRDFRKLPPEDQKQYWTWRHNHGDHDRDHHDNDRDHH